MNKLMQNLSIYLEEKEIILSRESKAPFLRNIFNGIGLFMSSIILSSFLYEIFVTKGTIYEILGYTLFFITILWFMYIVCTRFFTKVILTDRRIIVIKYGRPVFYNFKDVASYRAEFNSGWLTLKIKNKILPILSRTDGEIFHEKFLEVYPDFIEEKQKSNPVVTTLMVIYAFCCFFCLHQIKTNEYITAKQIRTEFQQVIEEHSSKEYFEKIFKKILINIDYQESKVPLKVIIDFYVDSNSNLEQYRIVKYSEDEQFNKSIINALKKTFPLEQEMPENLKKYQPVKMRINVVHNGTNNEFLIKNHSFWFEIFGPKKHTPYYQLVFKHH